MEQPPAAQGPSELTGVLVTAALAIGGSFFGRLYVQFVLGAQGGFAQFMGSALLPLALILSLTVWRALRTVPTMLMNSASGAKSLLQAIAS
jgi:hypothetical protein